MTPADSTYFVCILSRYAEFCFDQTLQLTDIRNTYSQLESQVQLLVYNIVMPVLC